MVVVAVGWEPGCPRFERGTRENIFVLTLADRVSYVLDGFGERGRGRGGLSAGRCGCVSNAERFSIFRREGT